MLRLIRFFFFLTGIILRGKKRSWAYIIGGSLKIIDPVYEKYFLIKFVSGAESIPSEGPAIIIYHHIRLPIGWEMIRKPAYGFSGGFFALDSGLAVYLVSQKRSDGPVPIMNGVAWRGPLRLLIKAMWVGGQRVIESGIFPSPLNKNNADRMRDIISQGLVFLREGKAVVVPLNEAGKDFPLATASQLILEAQQSGEEIPVVLIGMKIFPDGYHLVVGKLSKPIPAKRRDLSELLLKEVQELEKRA